MKSSFSTGNSNCVDVDFVEIDGVEYVELTDTKRKTGDTRLLFTRDEWIAFTNGVQNDEFDWDRLRRHSGRRSRVGRVAGQPITVTGFARTPENQAYVNGRHAARSGRMVPWSFETFCRRFRHDPADARSQRIYSAYTTGFRAEAHEKSMNEGN